VIEIGKHHALKITKQVEHGLYLADESGEEILMPNRYCPENFNLEDTIEVFVYLDNEKMKIATNLTPKILLNEFALLQVKAVTDVGAFMDWGLDKDLMVPFSEQKQRMEEGRWYIVYLDIDKKSDRLYASNKMEKHLQNEDVTLKEGDKVELLVWQATDLGFSVIVNNTHKGLIYENEIFRKLNIGDKLDGYVKKIREDNKIDVSIQALGYENFNDTNTELIYRTLLENVGFMAVTDKSSPEEIYLKFGMSKKAFKKSIGALYKQRKILIQPDGIKLI